MSARSVVGNVLGNGLSDGFRYPNASVGLWAGEETNPSRVPSNLQNPFPKGGAMDFFDGESRNFNTGVATSNFSSINHSFVHSFTSRFPKETIRPEMLVFVERSSKSPLLHFPNCTSEVASVHELNRYLVTAEGRAIYGRDRSCEKLIKDFGFMGSYNLNIPDYVVDSFNGGAVTARRARIADVTRAQMDKGATCADPSLAVVHLMAIHRTLKDQTGLVSHAPVTAKIDHMCFNRDLLHRKCPWKSQNTIMVTGHCIYTPHRQTAHRLHGCTTTINAAATPSELGSSCNTVASQEQTKSPPTKHVWP